MKNGFKQIVGKTIESVVVDNNERTPENQVFIVFTDGTYLELYGKSFTCASGIVYGGMEQVIEYINKFEGVVVKIFRRQDADTSVSDIHELAERKTCELYGELPRNPEQTGFLVLALIGVGFSMLLPVVDAISRSFGYALLARDSDVASIFMALGLVAAVGVYVYQKIIQRRWYVHNMEIFQDLSNRKDNQN